MRSLQGFSGPGASRKSSVPVYNVNPILRGNKINTMLLKNFPCEVLTENIDLAQQNRTIHFNLIILVLCDNLVHNEHVTSLQVSQVGH